MPFPLPDLTVALAVCRLAPTATLPGQGRSGAAFPGDKLAGSFPRDGIQRTLILQNALPGAPQNGTTESQSFETAVSHRAPNLRRVLVLFCCCCFLK